VFTLRPAILAQGLEEAMLARYLIAAGLAASLLSAAPAAAQARTYQPPRTPDGQPDLQGTFTFRTITPLQRPTALAGKETLTPEEAAAFETSENIRLNRDLYDPEKGQPSAGYPPRSQGGVLSYNDFWYERGNQLTQDKRTSLITDPPDGRIPFAPRTGGGRGGANFDNPETLSLADRCLLGFNSGPPMISSTYNNNVLIVQTRDYVVLQTEMIHEARIVPIGSRPHGTLPRWIGDSRGRWEGDTLVVETINFKRETSAPSSSATTKLVERFTRVGPDTITYEFTVTDPTTLTRPWTAVEPLTRIDEAIYEYACHEGNYGMTGILSGARFQEKEKAAK
jgi:hypothetical protein